MRCSFFPVFGSTMIQAGFFFHFLFFSTASVVFGVTTMITLVFIVCILVKLLQNFSRNPSRLSKAATTSYPRCGDVSGSVMASRFCSPYWWWKRHWLMQIVFVLWLVKRYVVYRGAKRLDKSLENYSCSTAASYKVSITQRGAFFTLVQLCILYSWEYPRARWS